MSCSYEEINLKTLENLIRLEQKLLEQDKNKLAQHRYIENIYHNGNKVQSFDSTSSHGSKNASSQPTSLIASQKEYKNSMREKSINNLLMSPREKEKEKLINTLSQPKAYESFQSTKLSTSCTSRNDFYHKFPVDAREKEKERLAEILASTGSYIKPSCYEISKNLNSDFFFNEKKRFSKDTNIVHSNLTKETEEISNENQRKNIEEDEDYLRKKYNIPKICISDDQVPTRNNSMVRIGEFSPLNPNFPGGKTVLGLGEWDERRKVLLEQHKQECHEHLQQMSRIPTPGREDSNSKFRSVATQTDWEDAWTLSLSPEKSCLFSCRNPTQSGDHVQIPHSRLSPIPKCFEGMSEKEIKEHLYREELRKQIEEKNRLKEELKRKEAEEEAKIEAKIQRDIEKERKQYEEERLHKLELAIRRREQEDLFRQRLAAEQQRALEESKCKKRHNFKEQTAMKTTVTQRARSTQSDFKVPENKEIMNNPIDQSLPENHAALALAQIHEELKKPLLEVEKADKLEKVFQPSPLQNKSPPIHRGREVDVMVQKAAFNANVPTTSQPSGKDSFSSAVMMRDKMKEVHNMLKQPLLPESPRVLLPVSPPLLHATVPPISPSFKAVGTTLSSQTKRTNLDILEDKWKVPGAENNKKESSAHTEVKPKPYVLTHLGTFRKQLQEERQRMRQRVKDESP